MIKMNQIKMRILKVLLKDSMLTRYELTDKLKIPRSTLYDNLQNLLEKNFINRIKVHSKRVGRPRVKWYINKEMIKIIKEKGFFSDNKFINQN